MRDTIYVYMKEPEVHVLGPGIRYALWVQGCRQSCPGCVAENAKIMEMGMPVKIDALVYEIVLSKAEGITISGGEPFLQAEELTDLLIKIHRKREMGVIVYTGYLYDELLKDDSARKFLAMIDLLIDGPYIRELDDGRSLRGSSNQRVLFLTDRYREYGGEYGADGRGSEKFYHGIYVHEIGIPNNKPIGGWHYERGKGNHSESTGE